MELKHFSLRPRRDEQLEEVAAKIKPLPLTVVPSDEMRLEMRLQLMQVIDQRGHATRRAA
jgi:hypothetical protein